jgi:hypothetical protein
MPSWTNKAFTFLDEEENQKNSPRNSQSCCYQRNLNMQLKKCYRKGCQLFAAHVEETPKDKVSKYWRSCDTK